MISEHTVILFMLKEDIGPASFHLMNLLNGIQNVARIVFFFYHENFLMIMMLPYLPPLTDGTVSSIQTS